MFKKFLLSLVFVGSEVCAQSDEDLVDLNAPLRIENLFDFRYIEQAAPILNNMNGFDRDDPQMIRDFMVNTFDKYGDLTLLEKNAFTIYVAFFADSEFGELGVSDDIIRIARVIFHEIRTSLR